MASTRPLVLFATSAATAGLSDDDRLFAEALVRRGVDVRGAIWDDETEEWRRAAAIIVRSTWDYHLRRAEFLAWAARVEAAGRLHNSAAVIRWNSHKRYLAALAARGVDTIDTAFVTAHDTADVAALARAHGWHDVVVKPAVSAAAYETRRFAQNEYRAAEAHLRHVSKSGDAMVQPYLAGLGARGELSLIYGRGRFVHAVRRRSALVEAGLPKSALATADEGAVRFGERVLAAAMAEVQDAGAASPLYARVDLAEVAPASWVLLELELIEPSLFFLHAPRSAELFADLVIEDVAARGGAS